MSTHLNDIDKVLFFLNKSPKANFPPYSIKEILFKEINNDFSLQILYFLANEGYAENIDIDFPSYRITIKGALLCDKGGYKKKYKRDKISDFPKTYWWVTSLITFALGFLSAMAEKLVEQKISPNTNQSQQAIPTCADSAHFHKTPHYR